MKQRKEGTEFGIAHYLDTCVYNRGHFRNALKLPASYNTLPNFAVDLASLVL